MKKLVIMSLLSILTACGGGSGDGGGDFTGGDDSLDKLVGVWDATTDEGTEGVDEAYIVIDAEGYLTVYDYAGDSFDREGNCYWIDVVDQLVPLGNNKYDSDVFTDLKITVSGSKMQVSGKDEGESFSVSYRRSSRTVSDLIPECSDSFATVPATKAKSLAMFKRQ